MKNAINISFLVLITILVMNQVPDVLQTLVPNFPQKGIFFVWMLIGCIALSYLIGVHSELWKTKIFYIIAAILGTCCLACVLTFV